MSQLKTARYFLEPVDPILLQAPDYFTIITTPMDYGSIKRMLIRGKYVHWSQVLEHLMLVSDNAAKYNPPGHLVHTYAKKTLHKLSRIVMSQLTKLLASVHASSIPPTDVTPSDPPLGPGPAKPLAPIPPFNKDRANKILQRIYDIFNEAEKPAPSPAPSADLAAKRQKRDEGLPRSFSVTSSIPILDDDDDDDEDDLFIQQIKNRSSTTTIHKGDPRAGLPFERRGAMTMTLAEKYVAKRYQETKPRQELQRYQEPQRYQAPPPHLAQRMPLAQPRQEPPKGISEPNIPPKQNVPGSVATPLSSLQFETLKAFVVAKAAEAKATVPAAKSPSLLLPTLPQSPPSTKLNVISGPMHVDTSVIKFKASYEARIAGYESKIAGLDKVIAEKTSKLAERDAESETLISINLELAAEVAQLRQHILNLEQQMTTNGLIPQSLVTPPPQIAPLPPQDAPVASQDPPGPATSDSLTGVLARLDNKEPEGHMELQPRVGGSEVEVIVEHQDKVVDKEDSEELPDWVLKSA